MKIFVMTDTHLCSKRNWKCDPYSVPRANEPLQVRESEEILLEAFDYILKDKETDVVLITGDITNNGERDSHIDLVKMLADLQAKGKKVYVTTSTHDFCYDGETSYGYDENGKYTEDIEVVKREELFDMYRQFGIDQSIDYILPSMSYVVDLDDMNRLMMLNDDEDEDPKPGPRFCGYTKEELEWIKKHMDKAKEDGVHLIATTHHPLIPPSKFYSAFSERDMLKNYKEMQEFFADNGVKLVLTGHTHMHKIGYYKSNKGNPLYSVGTGATTSYPVSFRRITLDFDNDKVGVETIQLETLSRYDLKGQSLPDYAKEGLVLMIEDMIKAMGANKDLFAAHARGISVSRSLVYTYWPIIKPIGKYLDKLTFRKVWKWTKKETGLKEDEIKEIKDKRFIETIVYAFEKLHSGDPAIYTTSPEYKITVAFFAVVDSFMHALGKENFSSQDIISELLFNNYIPDNDVVLDYKVEFAKTELPTYETNKGFNLLLLLIIGIVVFSPIVLPVGLIAFLVFAIRNNMYKNIGEGPHKPYAVE